MLPKRLRSPLERIPTTVSDELRLNIPAPDIRPSTSYHKLRMIRIVPTMASKFCGPCSSIPWHELFSSPDVWDKKANMRADYGFVYHPSPVTGTANDGCSLCHILYSASHGYGPGVGPVTVRVEGASRDTTGETEDYATVVKSRIVSFRQNHDERLTYVLADFNVCEYPDAPKYDSHPPLKLLRNLPTAELL